MSAYSDIFRSVELRKGLENYVEYLTDSAKRTTKRLIGGAVGEARGDTLLGAVKPFGLPLTADFLGVAVNYPERSVEGEGASVLGSKIGTRLIKTITPTDADKYDEDSGFSPARAIVFRPNGTRTYVQSKRTKLYYIKYGGDTFSCPFGATGEAEEFGSARKEVRATLLAGLPKYGRVSVVNERYTVR